VGGRGEQMTAGVPGVGVTPLRLLRGARQAFVLALPGPPLGAQEQAGQGQVEGPGEAQQRRAWAT